jgi:hypothetical protein
MGNTHTVNNHIFSGSSFADAVENNNMDNIIYCVTHTPADRFYQILFHQNDSIHFSRIGLLYYYLTYEDFTKVSKIIYKKDNNLMKGTIMIEVKHMPECKSVKPYTIKPYTLEDIMGINKFNRFLCELQETDEHKNENNKTDSHLIFDPITN